MTAATTAQPASEEAFFLGEGPVWDPLRERLLWVDIEAGAVHEGRLDPAGGRITATGRRDFGTSVGAVALAADGRLIAAQRSTLVAVDLDGGTTELARVLPADRASRLNDGAVDPAGRFLIGSLAQDDRHGQEVLARLDHDGSLRLLDTDLELSNGLAWSPDGDRLYSIDTRPGVLWVRDYDPASGRTGPRRELFRLHDEDGGEDSGEDGDGGHGSPDGMCVDADGNLWIARWGGGRVECRTPEGELLAWVEVAAPHTSSVAFAGPDLDVLVITTATEDLSPRDLAAFPDSGRLFTARVGARGLPLPYWQPPSSTAPASATGSAGA